MLGPSCYKFVLLVDLASDIYHAATPASYVHWESAMVISLDLNVNTLSPDKFKVSWYTAL